MNKILLINRIDTNKFNSDKKKIFFLIGNLQSDKIELLLMDTLKKVDFLSQEDIVYKYNGVEIDMKEDNIPNIARELMDVNIDVYSIYELYDPME